MNTTDIDCGWSVRLEDSISLEKDKYSCALGNLSFNKSSGSIPKHESQEIEIVFRPIKCGILNTWIQCKVLGGETTRIRVTGEVCNYKV